MSIEYRASLREKIDFQSGKKLKPGTIVYVEETPHGWVGKHYDNPMSAGGSVFTLEPEDFTLFVDEDNVQEIVVVPDPEPDEESQARLELARRRMANHVLRLREKADELEAFLTDSPAIPLVPGKE